MADAPEPTMRIFSPTSGWPSSQCAPTRHPTISMSASGSAMSETPRPIIRLRREVHRYRQRDPREPERLHEPQHQLAPVVHDDEVVEVVEVEGGEAEERDERGLEEAVLLVQLEVGVRPAQAQVGRRHHREED